VTNLLAWRAEVVAAREAAQGGDAYARLSAENLVQFFNSKAPDEYQISDSGKLRIIVTTLGSRPTARELAAVLDHFTRAVASIGQEIHDARSERTLGPTDYLRTPLYPVTISGGPLILEATRADLVMGALPSGDTTSEMALARLANLLPERPDDSNFASRLLAARTPSARAVHEVALAAKRVRGLTVMLDGTGEPTASTVDVDQAQMISELLQDSREETTTQVLTGRLDGVRFRRREFYLDVTGHDVHGVVDEPLVPVVRQLLNETVVATVERVTRITAAGAHQQPLYRLISLAATPKLL
jgi:hypothetical protein